MSRDLFIFDFDGTLCDISHRKHLLENKDNKYRWREFYSLCHLDKPKKQVIRILNSLILIGHEVWIFSGRSDEVRDKSVSWLTRHTLFREDQLETSLIMRREGDSTPDYKLKESWLNNMLIEDRDRIVAIFDDRDRVVQMWRDNGLTCLQVAPGNF